MKKYACHIPNIPHMVNMLYGQIGHTVLHIYAKTESTATSTSHVSAKYVPETNMPIKLGIYDIYVLYTVVHTHTRTTEGYCLRLDLASKISQN